jgi:hypothetical protein
MDKDAFDKTPKTYNKDGTPKTSSGFINYIGQPHRMVVIGVLCLIAYGMIRRRRY